jgi:hypothetical protein
VPGLASYWCRSGHRRRCRWRSGSRTAAPLASFPLGSTNGWNPGRKTSQDGVSASTSFPWHHLRIAVSAMLSGEWRRHPEGPPAVCGPAVCFGLCDFPSLELEPIPNRRLERSEPWGGGVDAWHRCRRLGRERRRSPHRRHPDFTQLLQRPAFLCGCWGSSGGRSQGGASGSRWWITSR